VDATGMEKLVVIGTLPVAAVRVLKRYMLWFTLLGKAEMGQDP
jgi:hypothetical protein